VAKPIDKIPAAEEKNLTPESTSGAHSNAASIQQTSSSPDFADSDKRWLKDLGITTTRPLDFSTVWMPDDVRKRSHRWAESYGGRLAIRSVSRGIVGAAFFSAGGIYARRAMHGYDPAGPLPTDWKNIWKLPLQFITKCIDKTVGKGIYKTAEFLSGEEKAKQLVTFRGTRGYGYTNKSYAGILNTTTGVIEGRSLGHEAAMITFDFAAMSFGDYMTRYALGLIDPNAKIKWIKHSADGSSHIDMPGALKDVLKNVWTGVSYAAGEDMAVAIPYVYGMRWQRNIINKFSPGFIYDSDSALNGGSFKVKEVDAHGKFIEYDKRHNQIGNEKAAGIKISGDYQLEGMLDLMGRFSWYNVGTKMFRDTYSHGAIAFNRWWHGDRSIHMPRVDPQAFTLSRAEHTARTFVNYTVRTIVKVMMYMLPSTFFFYITRSPQSKYLGMAIHAEKGPLGFYTHNVTSGLQEFNFVQADRSYRKIGSVRVADEIHTKADFVKHKRPSDSLEYDKKTGLLMSRFDNPFSSVKAGYEWRFEPFSDANYSEKERPWHVKITNRIGQFCHSVGDVLNELIMPAGRKLGVRPDTINDFTRKWANASIAYTPYFMAKTDLGATLWDTKRTDMGIDRTLHGAAHLDWNDFSSGFSEMYRSMLGQPFADPTREALAKEAMKRDREKSSNEAFQLVRGRGEDRESDETSTRQNTFAEQARKTSTSAIRPTVASLRPSAPQARDTSWAAQETINKADIESQGHTIH